MNSIVGSTVKMGQTGVSVITHPGPTTSNLPVKLGRQDALDEHMFE